MNLTKHYFAFGLLLASLTSLGFAIPLLPALGWVGISAMVEVLMQETLHAFLNPKTTPEDLQNVQQRVENVENYLTHNTPEGTPSVVEVTQLKDKLTQISALFAATQGQQNDLAQRISVLEQHLIAQQHTDSTTINAVNAEQVAPFAVKISYLYRKDGRGEFKPIQAHDILHHGDHVKIIFTAAEAVYVYIFSRDQSGKILRLYPLQQFGKTKLYHRNPVTAGTTNFVPAEHISLVVDRTVGTETLYFLASREKNTVLESFYNGLETLQQQQPHLQETVKAHRVFTQEILAHKSFDPELVADDENVTWQERGESLQAALTQFKNFCNGCVHIMEYQHE